tara:strand:- start:349 stop:738 length:390 start_codon:yes stop_codon:yes gene_type:complete
VSLVARLLENSEIPTLIIGSARDIVEHCGVPRFLYNDFPLGNPCGKPYDVTMQKSIMNQAITLLSSANGPNTIEKTPHIWSSDNYWRGDYAKVDETNREELAQRGQNRRKRQAEERIAGVERASMIRDT